MAIAAALLWALVPGPGVAAAPAGVAVGLMAAALFWRLPGVAAARPRA